jgi:hypothetical protein
LTGPSQLAGKWDLVTCFRYLDRFLFSRIDEFLAPGGYFVAETFTTVHREQNGRPASNEHVLNPNEFRSVVPTLKVVHFEEGWHGEAHTARIVAKRMDGFTGQQASW